MNTLLSKTFFSNPLQRQQQQQVQARFIQPLPLNGIYHPGILPGGLRGVGNVATSPMPILGSPYKSNGMEGVGISATSPVPILGGSYKIDRPGAVGSIVQPIPFTDVNNAGPKNIVRPDRNNNFTNNTCNVNNGNVINGIVNNGNVNNSNANNGNVSNGNGNVNNGSNFFYNKDRPPRFREKKAPATRSDSVSSADFELKIDIAAHLRAGNVVATTTLQSRDGSTNVSEISTPTLLNGYSHPPPLPPLMPLMQLPETPLLSAPSMSMAPSPRMLPEPSAAPQMLGGSPLAPAPFYPSSPSPQLLPVPSPSPGFSAEPRDSSTPLFVPFQPMSPFDTQVNYPVVIL